MSKDGRTDGVGANSDQTGKKDFAGSGVEGKKGSAANKEEKRAQARMNFIVATIPVLDQEKDFTKSGKPECDALQDYLGFDISAADRDQAWSIFQAENKKVADLDAELTSAKEEEREPTIITCDMVLAAQKKAAKAE